MRKKNENCKRESKIHTYSRVDGRSIRNEIFSPTWFSFNLEVLGCVLLGLYFYDKIPIKYQYRFMWYTTRISDECKSNKDDDELS